MDIILALLGALTQKSSTVPSSQWKVGGGGHMLPLGGSTACSCKAEGMWQPEKYTAHPFLALEVLT